jgi:hypothetical protein
MQKHVKSSAVMHQPTVHTPTTGPTASEEPAKHVESPAERDERPAAAAEGQNSPPSAAPDQQQIEQQIDKGVVYYDAGIEGTVPTSIAPNQLQHTYYHGDQHDHALHGSYNVSNNSYNTSYKSSRERLYNILNSDHKFFFTCSKLSKLTVHYQDSLHTAFWDKVLRH